MAAGTAANDLRELLDEELETRLREAKEELFNLRFQGATGQLDDNQRLRAVRRDIARIYTIQRGRELKIELRPDGVNLADSGSDGDSDSDDDDNDSDSDSDSDSDKDGK